MGESAPSIWGKETLGYSIKAMEKTPESSVAIPRGLEDQEVGCGPRGS